jgi:hypothetical protein
MYWAVVGFMGMLVLLMLGVSGICRARELRGIARGIFCSWQFCDLVCHSPSGRIM